MRFTKDSDAVLDYTLDWSQWLTTADTITASTYTVTPSETGGVTVDDQSFTGTKTTVWLSGGVAGQKYFVTNHITTSGGRQDDRSLRITVKEL